MKRLQRFLLFLPVVLACSAVHAQDTTDAHRLASLDYMQYAGSVDCANTNGINLAERICLNLKFQEVDSVLNHEFVAMIATIRDEKQRTELIEQQEAWVLHRRERSEKESEGLNGHVLGIYYLKNMVEMTEKRIGEIVGLSTSGTDR